MKLKVYRTILVILFIMVIFTQVSYAYMKEDALFASSSINIYSDKSNKKVIGTLEIGAKVDLIKKNGDWYEIDVRGWQEKGLPSVIYAFMGKRIVIAKLSKDGEKPIKIVKMVEDKDSGLTWEKVKLSNVWIRSTNLVKNMDSVWKYASHIFNERCSVCHALPRTTTFTANQWPATLKVMTRRAALDKKQRDLVSKFLQYHAKDTIKLEK